jgi:hypothetical protein
MLVSKTPIATTTKNSFICSLVPKYCTSHNDKLLIVYNEQAGNLPGATSMLSTTVIVYDINHKLPVSFYRNDRNFDEETAGIYCEHPTENEYYFWKDKFTVRGRTVAHLVGHYLNLETGKFDYMQSRWDLKPILLPSDSEDFYIADKSDEILLGYQKEVWSKLEENYFILTDKKQDLYKVYQLLSYPSTQLNRFAYCGSINNGLNVKIYYAQHHISDFIKNMVKSSIQVNCLSIDKTDELRYKEICLIQTSQANISDFFITKSPKFKIVNKRFLLFEVIKAISYLLSKFYHYIFVIDLLKNKYVIIKSRSFLHYVVKEVNENQAFVYVYFVQVNRKGKLKFELVKTINISENDIQVYTSQLDLENMDEYKIAALPIYDHLTSAVGQFITLLPKGDSGLSPEISAIFVPIDGLKVPNIPDNVIMDYIPSDKVITLPDNF